MSKYEVSTTINKFEHPETGSRVDLVSLMHVGKPEYYRRLGRYIMGRQNEGFTVHHEGISDDDFKPTGLLERMKLMVQKAKWNNSYHDYSLVNLYSSYEAQDYSRLFDDTKPNENHDIAMSEIIARTDILICLRSLMASRKQLRRDEKAARRGTEVIDEVIFRDIKEDVDSAKNGGVRNKRRDRVIIHLRNNVALEGVDSALEEDPSAKIVLIWGIGHLAGLQSGLTDRGYTLTDSQEIHLATNGAQIKVDAKRDNRKQAKLSRKQAKLNRRLLATKYKRRPDKSLAAFQSNMAKRNSEAVKKIRSITGYNSPGCRTKKQRTRRGR